MFQISFSLNIPNWCRCRYLTSYTASGHHHIGILCTITTEAKRNDDEFGETERKSLKSKRAHNSNQPDTWPDINKWHNIPKENCWWLLYLEYIFAGILTQCLLLDRKESRKRHTHTKSTVNVTQLWNETKYRVCNVQSLPQCVYDGYIHDEFSKSRGDWIHSRNEQQMVPQHNSLAQREVDAL